MVVAAEATVSQRRADLVVMSWRKTAVEQVAVADTQAAEDNESLVVVYRKDHLANQNHSE